MSLIQPGKRRTAKRRPVKRTGSRRSVVEQKTAYRRFGAICPLCGTWIPKDINLHKEKKHGEQPPEVRTAKLREDEALRRKQQLKSEAELAEAAEIARDKKRIRTLHDRSTARTKVTADIYASGLRSKKK